MGDIVNFNDHKKKLPTIEERISATSDKFLEQAVSFLHDEGYDLENEQFLSDLGSVLLLFHAAICNLENIENSDIKILISMQNRNEDE